MNIDKSAKRFEEISNKAMEICNALYQQCEIAQSKTLKELIGKELNAYVLMIQNFSAYMELHFQVEQRIIEKRNDMTEELHQLSMKINDPLAAKIEKDLLEAEKLSDKIRDMLFDYTVDLYLTVLSRDFKDWNAYIRKVLETIAKMSAGIIPGISEAQSIVDALRSIKELCEDFIDNGTTYSQADEQVYIIERHTKMLIDATVLFEAMKKNLSDYDNI